VLPALSARREDHSGGRNVITYTDLPARELARVLAGVGLPAALAEVLADADLGLSRGELFTGSNDLGRLIGRPTTALPTRSPTPCAEQRSKYPS
jgi:hypothetical protein